MITTTILLSSLACVTLATSVTPRQDVVNQPIPETGISLGGIGAGGLSFTQSRVDQDEQQALFAAAGMNANRSSSATFQYINRAGPQDDSTWTWRVNITNVDLSPLNGTRLTSTQGQYSANLQFDLQWPGGGELKDYLAGQGGSTGGQESTLCASRWSYSYPANVTSRYSASDNGNCSNVLGAECAASLLSSLKAGGPCARTLNQSYSEGLSGCQDTLDVTRGGSGISQGLGNSTRTLFNYRNESLLSGDPIYFITHRPLPPSNLTNFDAAQTYLNMLYLTGGGSGNFEPVLLCQVVTPPSASAASISWSSSSRWVALTAAFIVVTLLWM